MEGFVFPNEIHVVWTVMIVLYPYITGLVAGAFIVSSLYHVFGMSQLKVVSRFSLVSAFFFLLFAPVPLLNHLGSPQRALNIMLTPNFKSAMSGFGFVYSFYAVIVFLEIWFHYRVDFIERWKKSQGIFRTFYYLLLLGNTRHTEGTDKVDHKIVHFLAGLGIPVALVLHGYVGFLFGSIKANPWWSTPLMFIIFIFSAVVSGIAFLTLFYQLVTWIKNIPINEAALNTLTRLLWGFMIGAVVLEGMEVLSVAYEQTEEWAVLKTLIWGKLFYTYVVGQLIICSLGPFLLLTIASLFYLPKKINNFIVFLSSFMLLIQVLLMRWNVVIGGQLLSKSYRGFTSYLPGIFEKEGLLVAFLIFAIPFLLLREFDRIFPFFKAEDNNELQPTEAG